MKKPTEPDFQTLAAYYNTLSGGNVSGGTLKPATARKNVASLLLIARRGGVPDPALSSFTPALVERWRRAEYRRAGLDFREPNPEKNASLNSTLAQAKSVFSRRALAAYRRRGFAIPPNVGEFVGVPDLSPSKRVAFTPIDAEVDERMLSLAQTALDGGEGDLVPTPHVAAMFQMARLCGMTLNEILHFRREWVVKAKRGTYIKVAEDGTFTTKREAKNRLIPARAELVKRWLAVLRGSTFVENGTYAQCNEWLKRFLPERHKKLHELRKQACSEMLERTGDIFLASKFIGNSVQTTLKYYAGLMAEIQPL